MMLSTRALLLTLGVLVMLIAVSPASADTVYSNDPNMPIGKYINYYDNSAASKSPQNLKPATVKPKSLRMLLSQNGVQSTASTQAAHAVQTAAAATSTKAVTATENVDKTDQHYGDYFGGAISQPPPGAPVYYPPTYAPHGDHYDYIPGHYHNGRKLVAQGQQLLDQGRMLMASQGPDSTDAASKKSAVVQKLLSKGQQLVHHGRLLMSVQEADSAQTANKQSGAQITDSITNIKAADKAQWGGSGHYDYYGASYAPHGDHYDYIPAHYHYHEGNHWHRKLMAVQSLESVHAANKQHSVRSAESTTKASSIANTMAVDKAQHDGWEGNGHYDYFGPSYAPHGDHYDYIPAHYHYHEGEHGDEGNHWDHDDDHHKRL